MMKFQMRGLETISAARRNGRAISQLSNLGWIQDKNVKTPIPSGEGSLLYSHNQQHLKGKQTNRMHLQNCIAQQKGGVGDWGGALALLRPLEHPDPGIRPLDTTAHTLGAQPNKLRLMETEK